MDCEQLRFLADLIEARANRIMRESMVQGQAFEVAGLLQHTDVINAASLAMKDACTSVSITGTVCFVYKGPTPFD